jgi:hypothetical protein
MMSELGTCYKCGMLIEPTCTPTERRLLNRIIAGSELCTPNERWFLDRIKEGRYVAKLGTLFLDDSRMQDKDFPGVDLKDLVND